ncbi:hypothetical protein [Clostridium gasigenes]|uniref:Uncharacterized protein n=1 Tax=Clostridium gasigenes TaxID=94869 RepID=A0A7X0SEK9_9CLOT|nr:hypothetical protein [Clostridium gasigenes]MBB6716166.1 hypothetical protein [Clostridium gasigenes]
MKFKRFKYKNTEIIIKYCDYEKFNWYTIKYNGVITIYTNSQYDEKFKSKILHKVIRHYIKGKG